MNILTPSQQKNCNAVLLPQFRTQKVNRRKNEYKPPPDAQAVNTHRKLKPGPKPKPKRARSSSSSGGFGTIVNIGSDAKSDSSDDGPIIPAPKRMKKRSVKPGRKQRYPGWQGKKPRPGPCLTCMCCARWKRELGRNRVLIQDKVTVTDINPDVWPEADLMAPDRVITTLPSSES